MHSGVSQVGAGAVQQVADPYANEPERHPALVVRTLKPFNAETPGALLAGSPLTPVDLFYVRNHLPVPHIDAATHSVRLRLHGFGAAAVTGCPATALAPTTCCSRRNLTAARKQPHWLSWFFFGEALDVLWDERLCSSVLHLGPRHAGAHGGAGPVHGGAVAMTF